MPYSTFSFRADDAGATPLVVHTWLPDAATPVRGSLLLVHGMGEHAARYGRFATALTGRGWAVYAHDQRGHGQTAAQVRDLGVIPGGWAGLVGDVVALGAEVRRRHAAVPFVLMGHSMGAFEVQQVLSQAPEGLRAAVLSGSNGRPGLLARVGTLAARIERARLGPNGKSAVLQKLSFGGFNKPFEPARTAFDWLSRDAAEVDAYIADARCGFTCSTGTWVDFLDALFAISTPEAVARVPKDLPLYLFSGYHDPVGEMGAGVRRLAEAYRKANIADVTLKLYLDGRHEMLNDTPRDEVTTDLLAWLDAHVPG